MGTPGRAQSRDQGLFGEHKGKRWQRVTLAVARRDRPREHVIAVMLEWYLARAATDQPVHTWPAAS
jgi:hypothetical protein